MKRLLIGTNNPGKFAELKKVLSQYGFACCSLEDIGLNHDVEETGVSYQENAIIKAKEYARLSKMLTVADDSGLSIDALNGAPGLHSRDLYGKGRNTDQELLDWLAGKMKDIPKDKRTAKMTAAVAICDPQGKCYVVESSTEGFIAENIDNKLVPGYPYRAAFFIPKFNKYYSRLSEKEHQQVAHRTLSAKKLSKYFNQYD